MPTKLKECSGVQISDMVWENTNYLSYCYNSAASQFQFSKGFVQYVRDNESVHAASFKEGLICINRGALILTCKYIMVQVVPSVAVVYLPQ